MSTLDVCADRTLTAPQLAARRVSTPVGKLSAALRQPASPWRSKFARTMLLAALLLVALELGVRVRAYLKHGQAGTKLDVYATDAGLGALPRAGSAASYGAAHTTINALGLRGHEVLAAKPAGALRILCLGESTTFGQPSDDDADVWPAVLERLLREGASDRPVEVLNAAVPGFRIAQSRTRFTEKLAQLRPDIVIILHGATDLAAGGPSGSSKTTTTEAATDGFWTRQRDERSLAYNLLRSNTAAFFAEQYTSQRRDDIAPDGPMHFAAELRSLIADCRNHGADVHICTFPRAFDAAQSSRERAHLAQSALFFNPRLSCAGLIRAYERYNDAIRESARVTGVPLIDLDRIIPRGRACFLDSVHFSKLGHAQVAETVANAIAAGGQRTTAAPVEADHAVQ